MIPEQLWPRYASLWSADADTRAQQLPQCLDESARYADPNTEVQGHDALSGYMAGFQSAMPGCDFHIDRVLHHHDRSLAQWHLRSPDGQRLQSGISAARHAPDGRLLEIAGFFLPA